jgi:outer membrane immunogenic protein
MRTLILSGAIVLLSGVAGASDLPVQRQAPVPTQAYAPPPYLDWSGVYLGVNGGWEEGRSRFNFDGPGGTSARFGASGWQAGGTAGFNVQTGHLVLGVEGDIDWSDLSGSTTCPVTGLTCQTQNNWLGTARGRVGYAADHFLPYVTGGLAVGDINANIPSVGTATTTNVGWTAGAGVEYALSRNWSTKVEYLHVNLGNFDCGTACSSTPPVNVRLNEDLVRAGLNYKFDWSGGGK